MAGSALKNCRNYLPFAVIVMIALLMASAKQADYGAWSWMPWMNDFMGFSFVLFSMFKFFDLSGFADGFQLYDLLAMRFRPYAYIYPFLELGLGLSYLARWQPMAVYTVTTLVMLHSALGVICARAKGLDIESVCAGTVHKVPLSTIVLVENVSMAVMAGSMLIM